jgi:hypothetical protein
MGVIFKQLIKFTTTHYLSIFNVKFVVANNAFKNHVYRSRAIAFFNITMIINR